jgi:putative ABC transport system ATP-binding protein
LPAEPAASCSGLVKIYRTATGEVHALKGIDAVFPTAALSAVVGPSGSGKSSLLRLLAGLDRPSAGQIQIGGVRLSGLSLTGLRRVRRRLLGYVFQRPADNLISYLSVAEHLQLAARLRGVRHPNDGELLELLGLADRRHHLPHQLSGGEQQRVALARAFSVRPKVLFADEPTGNLDASTGTTIIDLMSGLNDDLGTTLVLVTHDLELASRARRTIRLADGRLVSDTAA